MHTRPHAGLAIALAVSALFVCAQPAAAWTGVAVFNFQMKSESPDWIWLEKALADRLITDLFRGEKIWVVQRDTMQRLAQKMRWSPGMMTSPDRLEQIRKALTPDYLVSGVYTVKGGKLTMTAVIVDFEKKKEVARRKVSGPTVKVLPLIRRLSAEVLGWLTKRSAEEVLKELPPWTRSIPAAKALYGGLHLYDQGRYAEAWRLFRQSGREDPAYTESRYWIGKMYYFMDRYEHARRSYEKFVYLAPSHPRMGDAIKEYLHTYEKLHTPPERMLATYEDLAERHPKVKIHNEMAVSWVRNGLWLRTKAAQLHGQLGRHEEAVERAASASEKLTYPANWYSSRVAMGNANVLNMLTGRALMPEGLAGHHRGLAHSRREPLRFTPDKLEAVSLDKYPVSVRTTTLKDGRTHYTWNYLWYWVVAPDGYVFKSLHFYPIFTEHKTNNAGLHIFLHKDNYMDQAATYSGGRTLREHAKLGTKFANLPRSGLFHVHMSFSPSNASVRPEARVAGIRAVAELEKIGPHGAIEVACSNTSDFRVEVDGRPGRKRAGLMGLVPVGRRKLRFVAGNPRAPFEEWTTTVDVREGQTTRVTARLPWRKSSSWASWQSASLIGRDYPRYQFNVSTLIDRPTIQADDEAIRVVWVYDNDLWASESRDGETFTVPARLGMPISSGWRESNPVLLRDESGRWLLAFLSDRGGARKWRPYISWSRDFVHWSSPVKVTDRTASNFDLIQDDRGRYVFVDATGTRLTTMVSRNAYRWERTSRSTLPGEIGTIRLLQRADGVYELFLTYLLMKTKTYDPDMCTTVILNSSSKDFSAWTPPTEITRYRGPWAFQFSPIREKGRTYLVCFKRAHNMNWDFIQMFRRTPEGTWARSRLHVGAAGEYAAVTWHRRWGVLLCWYVPMSIQFPTLFQGPFLLRGKTLDPFIRRHSFEIPRAKNLAVDGSLVDWVGVKPHRYQSVDGMADGRSGWLGPDDLSFTVRVAGDDRRLYVSMDVTDDQIRTDAMYNWQNDAVEVFWDVRPKAQHGSHGPGSGQVILQVPDPGAEAKPDWHVGKRKPPTGAKFACRRRKNGYVYELSIPYTELGLSGPPKPGQVIHMDLRVDDRDIVEGKAGTTFMSISGSTVSFSTTRHYAQWKFK